MPSFLAGQRLPASHLNALTDLSVDISGGPTTGTTGLVVGTLVIPAAPVDRVVKPYAAARVAIDTAGASYSIDIMDDSTRRGYARVERLGISQVTANIVGKSFHLPADSPLTLTAVLTRITGTGSASVQAGVGWSHLGATLSATP